MLRRLFEMVSINHITEITPPVELAVCGARDGAAVGEDCGGCDGSKLDLTLFEKILVDFFDMQNLFDPASDIISYHKPG